MSWVGVVITDVDKSIQGKHTDKTINCFVHMKIHLIFPLQFPVKDSIKRYHVYLPWVTQSYIHIIPARKKRQSTTKMYVLQNAKHWDNLMRRKLRICVALKMFLQSVGWIGRRGHPMSLLVWGWGGGVRGCPFNIIFSRFFLLFSLLCISVYKQSL